MKTRYFLILFIFIAVQGYSQKYEATWKSIDSRPVPEWFPEAKFGIFIHWGVYSVPAYRPVSSKLHDTYAEWYEAKVEYDTVKGGREFHVKNYGKDFEYRDFAPMFKAELWDPSYWADLFVQSGAKYVVLTSKHHDGFCLWPTDDPYAKNWNAGDVGPHRDLLGDLSKAVRARGLKMGIYYSLMEWESTPRNHEWSGGLSGYYLPDPIIKKYRIPDPEFVDDHIIPQLKELVMNYKPAVIFADGEWDKPAEYWHSKEFLAWLYNNAPNKDEVVVNDRWGRDTRGVHGGYYTSEYASDQNKLGHEHPWEESRGMGQSYGFNRAENIEDYQTSKELITELVSIVSRGGNLLLNIGPTADGRIPVIMQQRLVDIGKWLDMNGEAIYSTKPWKNAETEGQYYTRKGRDLYVILSDWPVEEVRIDGLNRLPEKCELLGSDIPFTAVQVKNGISIKMPKVSPYQYQCENAYVLKLTNAFTK